ncbi:MAG: hypothetical protein HY698_13570 [Deltaproteobacteria bacterium]|nr:hypothetical protein [Deltaproteobacteria bacterium]
MKKLCVMFFLLAGTIGCAAGNKSTKASDDDQGERPSVERVDTGREPAAPPAAEGRERPETPTHDHGDHGGGHPH